MSGNTFHHPGASRRQWWLVVTTGALTLVCGSIGLWQYDHAHAAHEINPVFCGIGALYHSMQMLILHTPHFEGGTNGWIEAGRWFGAFTLVATTWMVLWKRMAHEFRLFRLTRWSGHHVVCGLGQKGMEVVRHLKRYNSKTRIAVIDPHPDFADDCAALGVCVIMNDATKPEVLAQARVARAREVIVITPGDETNVRIATKVRDACAADPSGHVDCFVHLSNIHLRERLQRHAENDRGANCALHFFDVFDNEARRVLAGLPLDGAGITENDPRSVHLVIIGSGRMGRSLALRAAKMGHFANRKPVRISIIDRNAARQREDFLFRYPALENAKSGVIANLTFHQADAESLSARNLIEGWAAEPDTLVHLFICVDDNTCAVEVGLRFQEVLLRHAHCNLLVRIKTRESLAGILESPPSGAIPANAGPRIQTFGMIEDGCCEQAFRLEHNEAYARAAHEDFVRRRLADSNRKPGRDPALNDWSRLQEDLRESNRQQADHAAIKLRAIGCEIAGVSDPREAVRVFTPAEIELLAEMEHARWNAERLLSGWRYGIPSNKKERINENIRPWDELDDSIKEYDRQAVANILAILESATPPMKVVRKKAD